MTLQFDIRQLVHSLSDTLDLVGLDEVHHGKRVAFMAWNCAGNMQLNDEQLDRVYHASLLHDCGVSSSEVHRNLVNEFDWSESQEHCIKGEALLNRCRLFQKLSLIIRYHHTHWQDLPDSLEYEDALISNLIYLTDRVDALIFQQQESDILMVRDKIFDIIQRYRGSYFNTELVDVFLDVAENEFFWLTLEPRHLTRYLTVMEQQKTSQAAGMDTVLEISNMFADIVDAKSSFTFEHSKGVSRLSKFIGELLQLPTETLNMLEVAGLLHDLGKLNIPDEILEKPGPLTKNERAVMLRHSFESYQILSRITGFEEIAEWAAFHHEEIAGSGYPFRKKQNSLSIEARIIAVADVFQALAQNRPYRDSLPPEEIVTIMNEMTFNGKLDTYLTELIKENFDKCFQHAQCIE